MASASSVPAMSLSVTTGWALKFTTEPEKPATGEVVDCSLIDSVIGSGSKTVCVQLRTSNSLKDPVLGGSTGWVASPGALDDGELVEDGLEVVSLIEVIAVLFPLLEALECFLIFLRFSVPRPSALQRALSKVDSCSSVRCPRSSLQEVL